jgi:hypothetical protein
MKKSRSKQQTKAKAKAKAERAAQAENERALAKNVEIILGVAERARKQTIEDIIVVGERLIDSQSRLKHGKLTWAGWLEKNFDWSESTALNFMNVYRLVTSQEYETLNFKEMSIVLSELYALARPSTPKEVKAKIIGRAKAGEHIGVGSVDDAKASHQPQSTSPDTSEGDGAVHQEAPQPLATETSEGDGHEAPRAAAEESKREEAPREPQKDDPPREPDHKAKLRDTQGWAAEVTQFAMRGVRYGNPATKYMDPAVLREVVTNQMLACWYEGGQGLITLADKVTSVLATPSDDTTAASDPTTETPSISPAEVVNTAPPPMFEDPPNEATSDEGASSATAPENATSDVTT